jgi:hypothetical protein
VLLSSNKDSGLSGVLLNVLFVILPSLASFLSILPLPWNGKKLRMSLLPPFDIGAPEINVKCCKIIHNGKYER